MFEVNYTLLQAQPGLKVYITEVFALDPLTNQMCKWSGDYIYARSFEEAEEWCKLYRGYLKVVGELYHEKILINEAGEVVHFKSHEQD